MGETTTSRIKGTKVKSDLIREVANRTGKPVGQVEPVVNAVFAVIGGWLSDHYRVTIHRFGTWKQTFHPSHRRKGLLGDRGYLKGFYRLSFTTSPTLKSLLNPYLKYRNTTE